MIYTDGSFPYESAGLRGYVDGPYPFEQAGLNGMGFDITNITGGFSLQTVALIGGAALILFMMFKPISGYDAEKGMAKRDYQDDLSNAKKKYSKTLNEIEKRYRGRFSGGTGVGIYDEE